MNGFVREQRSRNMSAIKARSNKSTEEALAKQLRKNKIIGWRRHLKNIYGRPDFSFSRNKLAVFIDGCFWHGCKKHFKQPKTRIKFWKNKIESNILRDKKVNKVLKEEGWKVLRVWEHEIKKNPNIAIAKISEFLRK